MERQDIPPLELQLYAQLPQSIEELCSLPQPPEGNEILQEFERLHTQLRSGTMDTVTRQKVRSDLMQLLHTSQNGMEERIVAALHLLDRQTPLEELGEHFWSTQNTERVRGGP